MSKKCLKLAGNGKGEFCDNKNYLITFFAKALENDNFDV